MTIAGLATRGGPVDGRARRDGAGRDRLGQSGGDDGAMRRRHARRGARRRAGRRTGRRWRSRRTARSAGRWPSGAAGSAGSGYGPIRDTLLQARYVDAAGRCREGGWADGQERERVRSVPAAGRIARHARLHRRGDPAHAAAGTVRAVVRRRDRPVRAVPAAVPADVGAVGRATVWVLLEGHARGRRRPGGGARPDREPIRPPSCRPAVDGRCRPPGCASCRGSGRFVAEVGVGVVHHERPPPRAAGRPGVVELHRRIKHKFDPTGRLNPGLDVLEAG